ncbi:MAG: SDR family oxidoreductase [Betaproteobacteria bacterium]|nr:SDR family oxidoreductase [Betaproteobacteria bacterium]
MNASLKVAIVTGAGTGIGKASALALAKAGYQVAFAGRRQDILDKALAEAGGNGIAVATDVSDPASVKALFEAVKTKWGRVDVLFNNAGTGAPPVPMDELPWEKWKAAVDANLNGSFLCAQAAMALMKKQTPRGGRIINNGSISAHSPRPNTAAYTSTKHAITGLTKCISLDGRPFDIACGQIDIGNAATEMTERMAKGIIQANGQMMVEPRMDVQDVANAIVFMAGLSLDSNVQFMTIMATKMPFVGRG